MRNKARALFLGGGAAIAKSGLILGILFLMPSDGMMAHSSSPGQEEVTKKDFSGDRFIDTLSSRAWAILCRVKICVRDFLET